MSILQSSKMTEIRCKNIGRLLAKVSHEGIYLFCRQEKQQHLITWAQLEELKKEYKEEKSSKEEIRI